MPLAKRCLAELVGTFWLVLGGCGSAVLAAAFTADGAKISESTSYPLGTRISWCIFGVWIDCNDDGLCYRSYLWLSSQPCGFYWFSNSKTFPRKGTTWLYCFPSFGCDIGCRSFIRLLWNLFWNHLDYSDFLYWLLKFTCGGATQIPKNFFS